MSGADGPAEIQQIEAPTTVIEKPTIVLEQTSQPDDKSLESTPPIIPTAQNEEELEEVRNALRDEMKESSLRNDGITSETLIKERLGSVYEEDDGGFRRVIYAINGKTFSFRGREELPIYPALSSSRARVLGEEPKWVKPEDWQAYQKQVNETQSQINAPEHLVVSRTPLGIVEAAIALGSTDEELVTLRDEIRAGVYSERTLEIIDQLVAADFLDDNGEFLDTPSLEGEGLVILSLLGDEKAREIVDRKVEAMRRHDEEVIEQNKRKEPEDEPYRIEDLVVVHATRYLPQQDRGRYIIRTTQDAIGQKTLRNSVHFSLNGKVEANDGGNWSDSNYVVIEPMTDMIRDNGLPTELVPVDTFWSRNPGEPLILSNGTLIIPDPNIEQLYEISGNMVKTKTNVDVNDLKSLAEDANGRFIFDVQNRFFQAEWAPELESLLGDWNTGDALVKVRDFLHGENRYPSQIEKGKAIIEFLTQETGVDRGTLQDRMIDLLERSGAVTAIKPGVDRFAATDRMARALAEVVKAVIKTRIQEMAVRDTIERLGFEVKRGGDYTWDQESYDNPSAGVEARKRMEALASSLGITSAPHTFSPSGEISKSILRSIGNIENDSSAPDFDWREYELNPNVFGENIPKLDPKTRRAFYATGLLTARA